MFTPRTLLLICALGLAPVAAFSQGAKVALGGLKQDTTLPVEVTADELAVNQADGAATFSGNVLVIQGAMRMTAATVRVQYAADGKGIAQLNATGGVTYVNATDAAEAAEAAYTLASGEMILSGNVLLTQGQGAISGQKLVIDLKAGTGTMEGRVKTVFQPGGN